MDDENIGLVDVIVAVLLFAGLAWFVMGCPAPDYLPAYGSWPEQPPVRMWDEGAACCLT